MSRNAGFSSRSLGLLICAIALAVALVGSMARAGAVPAVRTWQGGSGPNWSTAGNWTPTGAPVDGEQLVFPTSTNLASNNDITSLDLDSIVLDDSYALTGKALTLDTGVTVTGGSPSLGFAEITLSGANTTLDVAAASTLTVTAPIRLENSLLSAPNAGTIITHGINGSGGLVAAVVASEFELDGAVANVIHGNVQAGAGALRVLPLSGDCLPVRLGLHIIGGELVVTGTLELGCPTLVGSGTTLAGAGNIVLSRSGGIDLTIGGAEQSTFSGVISGPGGLAVLGDTSAPPGSTPPALVLQGANTYTGPTNATAGYIALDHGSNHLSGGRECRRRFRRQRCERAHHRHRCAALPRAHGHARAAHDALTLADGPIDGAVPAGRHHTWHRLRPGCDERRSRARRRTP